MTDGIKVEHHLGVRDCILADRLGVLAFFQGVSAPLFDFIGIKNGGNENEESYHRNGK